MHNNQTHTLFARVFDTPLGEMLVCASSSGVCLLDFADTPALQKKLDNLQHLFAAAILQDENSHTRQVQQEIHEYFQGLRRDFSVKLHETGTAFQRRVWNYLQHIPYGQTTHYQAEAQKIGQPMAVRAAANANGANPITVIIPCHRVIGKNGQLTGYSGGLGRKHWLLQHEQYVMADQSQALLYGRYF